MRWGEQHEFFFSSRARNFFSFETVLICLPSFKRVSGEIDVLHWLPFPQRISYSIASLVWRCLSGWAPFYLRELCLPLSSCASRRTLRSFVHGNLVVPFARCATSSFFCGWSNNLEWTSNTSKAPPNCTCSQFHHHLKTALFRLAWVESASE